MLFTSPLFLWVFLPLTWLGHALARGLGRVPGQAWLVLASLAFYAAWELRWLPILLSSIALNHLWAKRLSVHPSRFFLGAGVALNLAVLGYFKYANFFAENLDAWLGTGLGPVQILLPLGFSFITFQKIAYLVDAHRGGTKGIRGWEFLSFVTFFPQLVAGPIVHHHEFIPQLRAELDAEARLAMRQEGWVWLSLGLFKKVMIADSLAPWAAPVFDQSLPLGAAEHWVGALAYTLQLYFDFSGYSEMALGLGLLFGIRLPINFNSPYQAASIADFWRRWHMTLSRFLRDHLYIPLGGNRHGRLVEAFALVTTFVLGGLWHGAGWTFLLWGALHGGYLVVQRGWAWAGAPWLPGLGGLALGRALTFAAVLWAWVPFRAPDWAATLRVWRGLLGLEGWATHPHFVAATGHFPKTMLAALGLLTLWCAFAPGLPRLLAGFQPHPAWLLLASSLFLWTLSCLGQPTTFLYWNF